MKKVVFVNSLLFQNGIPVYCPAITDGSIGDMLYLHALKNPGLVVDLVQGIYIHIHNSFLLQTHCHTYKLASGMFLNFFLPDVKAMDEEAVRASPRKTGIIILGGGIPKHHICNANMLRDGADYAVFINTAQEFDGSDSGARPDEALSWGKIKGSAKTAKVMRSSANIFST